MVIKLASGPPQDLLPVSRRLALALLAATSPLASDLRAASAAVAAPLAPSPLCDPCVSTVTSARGQEITLVGTAHISEDSALLVQRVLRQVKPDTVMIELDASRAAKLIGSRPASLKLARSPSDDGTVPAAPAAEPDRAPPFSVGRLAGRVLRGDLEEAKADAVPSRAPPTHEASGRR